MATIRDATDADLRAMLEIHNHYVLNTNALPQRISQDFRITFPPNAGLSRSAERSIVRFHN